MTNPFDLENLSPSWAKASEILKGDYSGHPFHGNQWQVVGANGQPVDKPNRYVRLNTYAGKCAICGDKVGAYEGGVSKSRDGKWNTYCQDDLYKHGIIVPAKNGDHCAMCNEKVELYTSKAGKTYVANIKIPTPHGPGCLNKTQFYLDQAKDPAVEPATWGTPERQSWITYNQDKADRAAKEYAYFAKK
jgi:hypothetical protein